MERQDLYRFVRSIHKTINHRQFHLVSSNTITSRKVALQYLPKRGIVSYESVLHTDDKGTEESTTTLYHFKRHDHFIISLAIVEALFFYEFKDLGQKYRTLFNEYIRILYGATDYEFVSKIDIELKKVFGDDKSKAKHSHSNYVWELYESYISHPMFEDRCVIAFHQHLHELCLVTFLLFDLYNRFGHDAVSTQFIPAISEFATILRPTEDASDEMLSIIAKHPHKSFQHLIQEFSKSNVQPISSASQHTFHHGVGEQLWKSIPIIATLFYHFNVKTLREDPKTYSYLKCFDSKDWSRGLEDDLVFEEHLYPFFVDNLTNIPYYVPMIAIEPSQAMKYYIEYSVYNVFPKELVEDHLSHKRGKAEVLVMDKEGSFPHFKLEIR
jgi:hypothetical protein